jgi:hypothetical protein
MKFFAAILSLYILALTAFPCIDLPMDKQLQKFELSQSANDNQVSDNDHCSPFCICRCCASPVVFQEFIIQFTIFSFSQKHLSGYTSSYVSSLFTVIWQPPKIS